MLACRKYRMEASTGLTRATAGKSSGGVRMRIYGGCWESSAAIAREDGLAWWDAYEDMVFIGNLSLSIQRPHPGLSDDSVFSEWSRRVEESPCSVELQ